MLKLYWGPHTCAIGIHILLEEIGLPCALEEIDVAHGGTEAPAFRAINPKGKVPTLLRDDGSVLTEFGAIATWLARSNPDAGLIADDADAEARTIELMEYVEGTLHGQGFARIFKPARFEPQDVVHQTVGLGSGSVKQQGRAIVEQAFAIIESTLGTPFAIGNRFTIADAALFYAARWAPEVKIDLPAKVAAHAARMRARPAVQKVLAMWGEA